MSEVNSAGVLADWLREEHGVKLPRRADSFGNFNCECPKCQHTRKKHKRDRPLRVKLSQDGCLWFCHHCSWKGGYGGGRRVDRK